MYHIKKKTYCPFIFLVYEKRLGKGCSASSNKNEQRKTAPHVFPLFGLIAADANL
jgi:hypothetical protein